MKVAPAPTVSRRLRRYRACVAQAQYGDESASIPIATWEEAHPILVEAAGAAGGPDVAVARPRSRSRLSLL